MTHHTYNCQTDYLQRTELKTPFFAAAEPLPLYPDEILRFPFQSATFLHTIYLISNPMERPFFVIFSFYHRNINRFLWLGNLVHADILQGGMRKEKREFHLAINAPKLYSGGILLKIARKRSKYIRGEEYRTVRTL